MTSIHAGIQALLDTPGVHPHEGWEDAKEQFFVLLRETATVEATIHGTLDYVQAHHGHKDHVNITDEVRKLAARRYWDAFNGTRRRSIGGNIVENAKALAGAAKKTTHN